MVRLGFVIFATLLLARPGEAVAARWPGDSHVAHIYSPITGRVAAVFAHVGSKVRKGQPLAWIDAPDIGSTSRDLHRAQDRLEAARRYLSRMKELNERCVGLLAKEYERALDYHQQAKAELARARLKARTFCDGVDSIPCGTFTVRAPIDGVVVSCRAAPGMEVASSSTKPRAAAELFTIASSASEH
jgi:cobalt-zinc-cadmium efflux system membrane fusion protein